VEKAKLTFRQADTYVENVIEPAVIDDEQGTPHENLDSAFDFDLNELTGYFSEHTTYIRYHGLLIFLNRVIRVLLLTKTP
jgi:hypothetical protein